MPILELPVIHLSGAQPVDSLLPMPPTLLAEINGAHLIAISAILGGLTFTILLIFFGLRYMQRRQELWHETAKVALEKGQPLPPLPADMRHEKHPNQNSDFRTGLILIATGMGLFLFFAKFLNELRFVATIPGFIGVALVVFAALNPSAKRKDPSLERPPQS